MNRITILILLAIVPLSASAQKPPEPPPIPLTAAEAQPLRDALTNEQMASLALAKAQAEKRAAFYKFCAEHSLKPSEWDIQPDGAGGFIAVKKGGETK